MAKTATYSKIASVVLGSAQSSVSITSIDQSYTDLIVTITGRDTNGYVLFRLNTDSGTNYSRTYLGGSGSSPYSARGSNMTEEYIAVNDGTNNTIGTITFQDYSNSTTFKSFFIDEAQPGSRQVTVGMWRNTNAINRIDFLSPNSTNSILTNTVINIYGIEAAK